MSALMLSGGGDFERYTFMGACNEPVPNNWKNACRRRAGHAGEHHSWDPRTGMDKGRHSLPYRTLAGRRVATVWAWGARTGHRTVRMLRHDAYVKPILTDRLMVEAIKSRERRS